MSELALVEVINLALGEMLDVIQWWASLSIGVIALTFFWEKKLNLPMATALFVAYTLFTAYVIVNVLGFGMTMNGYGQELFAMRDAGELSTGGSVVLDSTGTLSTAATAIFGLSLIGIYCSAVLSLIFAYRRGNKAPSATDGG